ncbi:MAG: DUF5715 family protein [Spirochaetia bacterium]|nr:DUF5715 family protein [Spirochaetia bacterium]
MKFKVLILFIICGILAGGFWYHKKLVNKNLLNLSSEINAYIDEIYSLERKFIENIPIYEDFANTQKEKDLRKYLLQDHIKASKKHNEKPVQDEKQIEQMAKENKLTALRNDPEALYYFYNVPLNYRYLSDKAAEGLEIVTERFQENLKKKAELPPVKIAVSSALRPVNYQNSLRDLNSNASFISSHSFAASFDIFYDDFYVVLPEKKTDDININKIFEKIRTRFGFITGDALRRQLKTTLMETLIELQREGILYAILEKTQRCYHVTILKDK